MASSLATFKAGARKFAHAAAVATSVLGFSSSIVVVTNPAPAYAESNLMKKANPKDCRKSDKECLRDVSSINRNINLIYKANAGAQKARAEEAAATERSAKAIMIKGCWDYLTAGIRSDGSTFSPADVIAAASATKVDLDDKSVCSVVIGRFGYTPQEKRAGSVAPVL